MLSRSCVWLSTISMRSNSFAVLVLLACWVQCWSCMPVNEFLSRNLAFAAKYDMSSKALSLMSQALQIPAEIYSDEQARTFVKNGLLYLEQSMLPGEVFNKLGGEAAHISRSTVHGIEEVQGGEAKPRWRWLPLIDRFDSEGRPQFHTSRWSDGSVVRVWTCCDWTIISPGIRSTSYRRQLFDLSNELTDSGVAYNSTGSTNSIRLLHTSSATLP